MKLSSMRLKYFSKLSILLLSFTLWSCKPKINYKMQLSLTRLTKENIYNKELVGNAIFDAQELQIDSLDKKSNRLFLKGVDLYKNKKDPAAAIEVFKQSLLVFPRVETYYEIGSALMDMQATEQGKDKNTKLHEALQAYEVAEHLHYQPIYSVYYNMACADNLLGYDDSTKSIDRISLNLNQAVINLRNAFMNGFNDTAKLLHDERLSSLIKTGEFKQLMDQLDAQKNTFKPETIYDLYVASFPNLPQPFVITYDSVDMRAYHVLVSFDFARFIPEMENTEFGRDVSHDYYAVGKLATTPLYTAIIYTSTEFNYAPVYTKLVTYTPNGNIIDSRVISCHCTPEKVKTVRIEGNIITTEEYKITWKTPNQGFVYFDDDGLGPGQTAVYDSVTQETTIVTDTAKAKPNTIIKTELLEKEVYKLTTIGKIVPINGDSTKVTFN